MKGSSRALCVLPAEFARAEPAAIYRRLRHAAPFQPPPARIRCGTFARTRASEETRQPTWRSVAGVAVMAENDTAGVAQDTTDQTDPQAQGEQDFQYDVRVEDVGPGSKKITIEIP